MKPKEYNVLAMCVENGVALGLLRVAGTQFGGKPDPQVIRDTIQDAVLGEICVWFDFKETHEKS